MEHSPSYTELMQEVMPVYHSDPERFLRFYHAVYLKLATLPVGGCIVIDKACKPQNIELFMKTASLCIIEEVNRKEAADDFLEFSDDKRTIYRKPGWMPHKPRIKSKP